MTIAEARYKNTWLIQAPSVRSVSFREDFEEDLWLSMEQCTICIRVLSLRKKKKKLLICMFEILYRLKEKKSEAWLFAVMCRIPLFTQDIFLNGSQLILTTKRLLPFQNLPLTVWFGRQPQKGVGVTGKYLWEILGKKKEKVADIIHLFIHTVLVFTRDSFSWLLTLIND